VERLLATVAVAVIVFATTNVDDLVVLTFFFMATRNDGRLRTWQVVAGQAAGVTILTASAAVAAIGLLVVPGRWIGLLGVFPLAIGLWKLAAAIRHPPHRDTAVSVVSGLSGVAAIAIINGADNITIYTPLLRNLAASQVLITLAVFAAMIGLWCAAAAWLASRLAAIAVIRRLSHLLVPVVLIAIGAIILTRSAVG
jgi:cadmium resistance protein CadD (predicted permease)